MGIADIAAFTQQSPTNIVEASKISRKKLTHAAAIYNSKGKRVGKSIIKKGKKVKVTGTINIKGKKYYKIGKNRFVKVANFKKATATKKSKAEIGYN